MKSKKKAPIAAIALSLLLAAGCQATPKESIVETDEMQLTRIAAPPLEPGKYEAPTTWKEEFSSNSLQVTIDAQIEIPDLDQYPVKQISKKKTLDNIMRTMIRYLSEGNQVYAGERVWTKEEWTELLISIKAGKPLFGYHTFPGAQEFAIEDIENLIRDAPEKFEQVPIDIAGDKLPQTCHFTRPSGINGEVCNMEDAILFTPAVFEMGVQLESDIIRGDAIMGEPAGSLIGPIGIAEQEAIEKGELILADLGINGLALSSIEKGRLLGMFTKLNVADGWYLTYHPENEGLQADLVRGSATNPHNPPAYTANFPVEQLTMLVNENGVHWIYWLGIAEHGEVVNENVELLPFDQVQKKIKQVISNTFGWNESNEAYYDISSVALKSALIPAKDDPDAAMYIPAWFITGEIEISIGTFEERIVISAIDGRKIEQIG